MNENLHNNFDDLFKKAQDRLKEKAPDGLWDQLQDRLDELNYKKRKRRIFWWKIAAATIIVAISGTIILKSGWLSGNNKFQQPVSSDRHEIKNAYRDSSKPEEANSTRAEQLLKKDSQNQNIVTAADSIAEVTNESIKGNKKPVTTVANNGITKNLTSVSMKNHSYREKINGTIKDNSIADSKSPSVISKNSNKKIRKPAQTEISPLTGKAIVKKNKKAGNDLFIQNEKSPEKNLSSSNQTKNPIPGDRNKNQTEPVSLNTGAVSNFSGKKNAVELLQSSNSPVNSLSVQLAGRMNGEYPTALPAVNSFRGSKSLFKPYWYITPFYSLHHADYRIGKNLTSDINENDEYELSYSAGIFAGRQLTKRWGIKTGLFYSKIEVLISPHPIYASKQPDGDVAYKYDTYTGYGFIKPDFGLPPSLGDSLNTEESEHNLHIISIPVTATYKIGVKKFSISPSLGFSTNFIAGAKLKTEVSDALNSEMVIIKNLEGMRRIFFGLIADASINYEISPRISATILPSFRYALTPITQSPDVKTYPYSLGIGGGLTFKF